MAVTKKYFSVNPLIDFFNTTVTLCLKMKDHMMITLLHLQSCIAFNHQSVCKTSN